MKALQDARIRVFSFTTKGFAQDPLTAALQPCNCGTGCRLKDTTHVGDGWSAPYAGKPAIPAATDGKNFDLSAVQKQTLAETIKNVVVESYCVPPVI